MLAASSALILALLTQWPLRVSFRLVQSAVSDFAEQLVLDDNDYCAGHHYFSIADVGEGSSRLIRGDEYIDLSGFGAIHHVAESHKIGLFTITAVECVGAPAGAVDLDGPNGVRSKFVHTGKRHGPVKFMWNSDTGPSNNRILDAVNLGDGWWFVSY